MNMLRGGQGRRDWTRRRRGRWRSVAHNGCRRHPHPASCAAVSTVKERGVGYYICTGLSQCWWWGNKSSENSLHSWFKVVSVPVAERPIQWDLGSIALGSIALFSRWSSAPFGIGRRSDTGMYESEPWSPSLWYESLLLMIHTCIKSLLQRVLVWL